MAEISLSMREPGPPKADFAIYIDFDRETEKPQRIFKAIEGLISAFERLDRALLNSIDSAIEPVLVLEDIEAGSLKVWLRDKLKHSEDQSLYELDWKPMVGKYLVAAKYAFIEWVNDEEERKRPGSLADLRKKFMRLAAQTDIKKMPVYGPPSAVEIIGSAEDMATALENLGENDKAKFLSDAGDKDFNLTLNWGDLDISDLAVREIISGPPSPMILAVRRPDYLGDSQWEFRHGKRTIRARITDTEWLSNFQERLVDVRPGDALRCLVAIQIKYGYDNELISENYTITAIDGVLENQYKQSDLFDSDDE